MSDMIEMTPAAAVVADLSPFLKLPLDGWFTASTPIAQVVASGQMPALASRAASGLLLHRNDRLLDLLPALHTLRETRVPLSLLRRRTSNVLIRGGLTDWATLVERTVDDLLGLPNAGTSTVLDILDVAVKQTIRALTVDFPGPQEGCTADESAQEEHGVATLHTTGYANGPIDDVGVELLVAVRLLASWAVSEGQGGRLSNFIKVPSRGLPPDVEQAIVDAGMIEVEQLAYPHLTHADLGQLAEDVLNCLTDDRRMVAERRILTMKPDTLERVGRDLGVTRERARQIQLKVHEQLTELLQDDLCLPLRWRAATLATTLGRAVLAASPLVHNTLREISQNTSHPDQLIALLVFLAGPYRVQNGWWIRAGADLPAVADLLATMGGSRHMSVSDAAEWLVARQLNPELLRDWVQLEPKLKVQEDLVLDWSGSAVDKSVTLLSLWRRPASAEELVNAVDEGHNPRGIRQRFFDDPRFMRVNRTDWVLRDWGGEEYTGISEEIEQRILEWGGRAKLSDLVDVLVEQFGVAAGSVRVYAEAPKFVIEDGWVRLRTAADALEARQTLPGTGGLYRRSPSSWAHVLHVDSEVLRGSGRHCPEVFARALPLNPGEEYSFDGPAGPLRITWPITSAFGPSLGSTRALALHVGAQSGDDLRIQFDLSRGTCEPVRITPTLLNESDNCSSLRLLTGLDLRDGELAEGVANGVGTTPAELVGVLRRRGDDQVADLLPPPADVGLTDALADLAALFGTD